MDLTVTPGLLSGQIPAIPSKSQAHRLMLCSAFADSETELLCSRTSQDMEATAGCLRSLGASVTRTEAGCRIRPIREIPKHAVLDCRESGSTLRFLLPVAGALGVCTVLKLRGRLPQRPLSPLWEEMERMGCRLSRPAPDAILLEGKLRPGAYRMDGGVSSQFVTGLLFGLSLLNKESTLELTGTVESAPYIRMTLDALSRFGVEIPREGPFFSPGGGCFRSPGTLCVEGDWSNAAFWLGANALGSRVTVTGLSEDSPQGDRAIAELLNKLDAFCTIDASQTPDLVPILAVVAGGKSGCVFTHAQRLRMKESDRLESVKNLICSLGGRAQVTDDGLRVEGTGYRGGTVSSAGDHRIAMAAAVAATVCREPVTILGAQAVEKSDPGFWADYQHLGGIV